MAAVVFTFTAVVAALVQTFLHLPVKEALPVATQITSSDANMNFTR
jgi:hypothetical protein